MKYIAFGTKGIRSSTYSSLEMTSGYLPDQNSGGMNSVGISSKVCKIFLNDILIQTFFKLIQSNDQLRPLLRGKAFKSACEDVQTSFWRLKTDDCPPEFILARCG